MLHHPLRSEAAFQAQHEVSVTCQARQLQHQTSGRESYQPGRAGHGGGATDTGGGGGADQHLQCGLGHQAGGDGGPQEYYQAGHQGDGSYQPFRGEKGYII